MLITGLVALLANLPDAPAQGTIGGPAFTNLVAYLNGACEVPPNETPYDGTAVLKYDLSRYNPLSNTVVTCSVSLPPELSPVSAAIYGPAAPGEKGPLVFDLGQAAFTTNTFCVVFWPTGQICFPNVTFGFSITFSISPEQMTDLNAGRWYVDVATAAYPGGEIRGQWPGNKAAVLSRFRFQPTAGSSFSVTAQPNTEYVVEACTNLGSWFALTNLNTTNSLFQVLDPGATNSQRRLYRVKSQ